MAPRARPAPALLLALFLVFVAAACSPDTKTPLPSGGPGESAGSATTVKTTPCATSVGGSAQLDPQPDPPPEDEVPGAGEPGAIELNEGEPPPVPKDPKGVIPDLSGTPEILESPSGAQGNAEPEDLVFYQPPTDLAAGNSISTVAEPQVAIDGVNSLVTWNWLASMSTDGGASYEYINPSTAFPSVHGGFCCDQLVLHVPQQDAFLWVLQYVSEASGANTIRLAWADDAGFEAAAFKYVDWTAADLGLKPTLFLDQPKIAATARYAYLSINGFDGRTWDRSVVIRIPLDQLVGGGAVQASCLIPSDPESGELLFGAAVTRGASDAMYVGAHISDSELGLFGWRDADAAPTFSRIRDVDANGNPVVYPSSSYTCVGPGSDATTDWCSGLDDGEPHNDDRPTAGWVANGHIGFAWNAGAATARPYPFVWVVVLDEAKVDACTQGECILAYPQIFANAFAIQYADIVENAAGELGAVAIMGGGDRNVRCGTLLHESVSLPDQGWRFLEAGVSTGTLPRQRTGDYLGVALDGPGSNSWIGACMSYQAPPGGSGMNIHVARFGRQRDDPLQ